MQAKLNDMNKSRRPAVRASSKPKINDAEDSEFFEQNSLRNDTNRHITRRTTSNQHAIQQFLNSSHETIITGPAVKPHYLNDFDQFNTQTNNHYLTPTIQPVVQVKKTYDQPYIRLIPDRSDGKLHINHF